MRKLRLILVTTIVALFLGMSNVNAQAKNSQIVIIKAYEFAASGKSKMTVTDPKGSVTEIKLSKILSSEEQNTIPIQKEINKWKNEGFVIEGVSSGFDAVGLITTIILSKDE